MSERGSPAFYRDQAERLTVLAGQLEDPALKQQFQDLAKSLTMIADFAGVTPDAASSTDAA